jgi:hypothetical protein
MWIMFLKNFCTLLLTLSLVNGSDAEPLWWNRISTESDSVNLETCASESEAPINGTSCPNIPETCFFGTQDCDGVGAHPETKCVCDDEAGSQEWKCEEETCPAFPPPSSGCPVGGGDIDHENDPSCPMEIPGVPSLCIQPGLKCSYGTEKWCAFDDIVTIFYIFVEVTDPLRF